MSNKAIEQSIDGGRLGITRQGDIVLNQDGMQTRVIAGSRAHRVVKIYDDFTGDLLTDEWNTQKGSEGTAVVATINNQFGGVVRLVGGANAAGTYATNGVQLDTGALNLKAEFDGLAFVTRVKIDVLTNVALFVGFTDQTAALEMPINASGAAAILTTASDAVGILFDTTFTSIPRFLGVGVKADVDAAILDLGVAPVAATYVTLRVEVDKLGAASFFVDGKLAGKVKMTNAITPATLLTPVVATFSRGAAIRNIDVDYIEAYCDRTLA